MKEKLRSLFPLPALPRWRKLLVCLSLLGFLLFFFPVFARIVNPVNLAAMAGFLLLAAVFLFWPRVLALLARLWRPLWGRLLLSAAAVGLLVLSVLVLVLCGRVASRLRARPESPCPTVVVLGCQVQGTRPCLLLRYRIQAAADYLRENPEASAILSGGRGPGEDISEADCMYRELCALGVDPARLRREDRSTSTEENIRFSMDLMEREGLRGPVVLVSNDFHICRALELAEREGLAAEGLAAPSSWYSRPTYVLREALCLLYYGL